ncbi:LOW QUALITY PROTEIN: protein Jade-1-like [Limulus polyphemus]|uniref:LOW QUALITY PROTEIN: protein Jade-1-like n=1 Tax=Limulus polyphemus TaxID=6850 RepID=A0ABM1B4V7_LIMPO|nr:LOW QUALITY PROTEIN: protein Jade-1-like [Limulus polyphemus]
MASAAKGKRNSSVSLDVRASFGKKRRRRYSGSESEDSRGPFSAALGKIKLTDPPMSKIYNSSFKNNKPAELFRKDLISAMKLPDSDQLSPEDYWLISDSWKQEWEKGVQVPVNPDNLAETSVRVLRKKEKKNSFKLPKKYIRCSHDQFFSNDLHVLTNVATQAEKVCRYDLDDLDVQWLKRLNEELDDLGQPLIEEVTVEYIIEDLETQCFENLEEAIKSEEGLGIEYDEDVICDVCRSPDSEEGNEMVFCDFCNICVHQACYGITNIPEGSWVCRTCVLGVRPACILCPNRGGAMKTTRSGRKWAHVSCALWIPEVSIGNVDKMEPITKISEISPSRWSLLCSLCRERVGACIQCSVKTCKTAYHVTCAFENNLDMKAIMEDEKDDDGVKLRSYCQKHSQKKEANHSSDSEVEKESPRKKKMRKIRPKKEYEMSSEDRANAREKKIVQMSSEFYNYVNTKETADLLQVDPTVVDFVYQYWKLKRKAQFDKPLLTPKEEETDILGRQQEDSLYTRMKMFVHLRQDLERVRNLCYMVSRREKLFRSWLKLREEIFQTQARTLANKSLKLTSQDIGAVMIANKGSSVYDKMYSMDKEPVPCTLAVLARLKPEEYTYIEKPVKKKKLRPSTQRLPNPYAKQYINGTYARSKRRLSAVVCRNKGLEKSSEPVFCDSKNQDDIKMELIDRYQPVHSRELSETVDVKVISTDTSISTNNSLSMSLSSVGIEGSDEKASTLEISKNELDGDLGENYSKMEYGGEAEVKKHKEIVSESVEKVINWESNSEPIMEYNEKELVDEDKVQACKMEIVEETKVKLSEQELTIETEVEANKNDLANEVEMKVNEQELVSEAEVEASKTELDIEDEVNVSREKFIGEIEVKDSDKELVADARVKVNKKELGSEDEVEVINKESCDEIDIKVSVNNSVTMPEEKISTKESSCDSIVKTPVEELGGGDIEPCLKEVESETSLLDISENTREPEKGLPINKSSSESNTLKLNLVEKLTDLLPVIEDSRSNNENVIDIKNTYSLELLKEVDVTLERTDQLSKLSTPKLKVPEKSPLAATNLQKSSSLLKTPKKEDRSLLRTRSSLDHSPDKDRLREESAKICESIFATTATSRGSLSGYRIPKKVKSENNILENTRGNSPVSPLSEVSSPKKDTFSTGDNYQKFRTSRNWSNSRDLISHSTLLNGENQGQSKRLVIKLRKDPNFPDSPRWKRDPTFGEGTDAFKVVQNDWQSPPKRTDRHLRSDRRSVLSNPTWLAKEDCGSKENGANSRYSMRFRTTQNMSKPDTGVS